MKTSAEMAYLLMRNIYMQNREEIDHIESVLLVEVTTLKTGIKLEQPCNAYVKMYLEYHGYNVDSMRIWVHIKL